MRDFEVKMTHNEDSLMRLSRMQYDLFCMRNRIVRTALSVILIIVALKFVKGVFEYLIIAYACFLLTNTYASSDRVAHKLTEQIKKSGMGFPASRYVFSADGMHVFLLPEDEESGEPLKYSAIAAIGEDSEFYYIFRDRYGGYPVPKKALGDRNGEFKKFLEKKTGKICRNKRTRLGFLRQYLNKRENEPYHL